MRSYEQWDEEDRWENQCAPFYELGFGTTSSGLGVKETLNVPTPKEADPTGRKPHEPGAKLDAGKVCAFRGAIDYFPRAILSVATVSTFGAIKYAWKGWETVPEGFERYSDAMVRHLLKEGTGEITDSDSGLLHAAHAAWNALARLELKLKEAEGEVSVSS